MFLISRTPCSIYWALLRKIIDYYSYCFDPFFRVLYCQFRRLQNCKILQGSVILNGIRNWFDGDGYGVLPADKSRCHENLAKMFLIPDRLTIFQNDSRIQSRVIHLSCSGLYFCKKYLSCKKFKKSLYSDPLARLPQDPLNEFRFLKNRNSFSGSWGNFLQDKYFLQK